MQIESGSNGNVAEVDDESRLLAFAVVQTEDRHANIEGRYWTVFVSVTPTGANDNFFYLKNDGTSNLKITDIRASSTVATRLLYKHVSGAAVGGTPIVPVSRLLGSAAAPNATIQQGVDITGLVDQGDPLFFEECDVPNRRENLKTTSNIMIPQGQAVAFERVAGTGAITIVISLSEEE